MRFMNYYIVVMKVCEINKYMWISRSENAFDFPRRRSDKMQTSLYFESSLDAVTLEKIFSLFFFQRMNNCSHVVYRETFLWGSKIRFCGTRFYSSVCFPKEKDAKRRNEIWLTIFHPVLRSGNFRYERSESGNRASSEHPSDADSFCHTCKKTYCGGRVRAPKSESLM